ncbi:glucokinase [Oceanicola granulosus HTCC2516]|uniref:Glucokinase n=1 Tax=Oceanicola granulosus (strain ATCC BAA-861 / DSM 15982 / KCTC 12143 / HTCC2516) TaxID=314256 RepID=Q2CGB6_OCEGH|nr:ROK family protein [Oceanicola granulosus]EAR51802.1 glucokinase [Oceanicola granulosus HTCC2516]
MPQPAETALGVDVGGTRIRVARVDADGRVEARLSEPTDRTRDGFSAQLARLVSTLRTPATVAVGVGLPGRVDGPAQQVVSAGYLDIAGLDVAALTGGLPVRIENDATMALIAEGQGSDGLLALVSVGTGIGGAALLDGRPWYGAGFAGQFGHIIVADDGPACNCGARGCVETLSSGTALGTLVAAAGLPATTRAEDLLARAAAGDARAHDLLATWARPMARALQSLTATVDPARIILGGGLGRAMAEALARLPQGSHWFARPVAAARFGDDAGMIGAALAGRRAARAP